MTFANAINNQMTTTTNGMDAYVSTTSACLDLFYAIGASRGKDIIPTFVKAFVENPEVAIRIALWGRDARQGAGERQVFRDIFKYLENTEFFGRVAAKVPELGRWDDLLVAQSPDSWSKSASLIKQALNAGNGLCAKWMPRKGEVALKLREFLGLSPKAYRKLLVGLTKVVEQQMCAKDWDNINFSHVPSVAAARYRSAFQRNTVKFAEYVQALSNGDPSVKVNAEAVFPHTVIQSLIHQYGVNTVDEKFITAQWQALPNYMGNNKVLPVVDVSGSMFCSAGSSSVRCIDVAVALGLYCADKNTGAFNGVFCTFSEVPQLEVLSGSIVQKVQQLTSANWGMSTNLEAALQLTLDVATSNNVPAEDMPTTVVIFSDMQFDHCMEGTALNMIRLKYEAAGYVMPTIVFWNLNAHGNVPARKNESGVVLVSGFSPAIMQCILSGNLDEITPEAIMLKAVMNDRYSF